MPFSGLWLEAAPNILERRIDSRRRDASDATADVLRGQLERDVGPVDWQRIDATGSTETVVATARQALA